MEWLLAYVTLKNIVGYFSLGFLVWFILYFFDLFLSEYEGRGFMTVFKGFGEEAQWFLPGGLEMRTNNVRLLILNGINPSQHYSVQDIRENGLYESVAKEAFGSGWYFWGVKVGCYFFLWPLTLIVALVWFLYQFLEQQFFTRV